MWHTGHRKMFTHIILVLCWQAACVDNLINNSASPPVCLRQCFIPFATPEPSSRSWISLASAAEKHIPRAPCVLWCSSNDNRWGETGWQVKSGDTTGPSEQYCESRIFGNIFTAGKSSKDYVELANLLVRRCSYNIHNSAGWNLNHRGLWQYVGSETFL